MLFLGLLLNNFIEVVVFLRRLGTTFGLFLVVRAERASEVAKLRLKIYIEIGVYYLGPHSGEEVPVGGPLGCQILYAANHIYY